MALPRPAPDPVTITVFPTNSLVRSSCCIIPAAPFFFFFVAVFYFGTGTRHMRSQFYVCRQAEYLCCRQPMKKRNEDRTAKKEKRNVFFSSTKTKKKKKNGKLCHLIGQSLKLIKTLRRKKRFLPSATLITADRLVICICGRYLNLHSRHTWPTDILPLRTTTLSFPGRAMPWHRPWGRPQASRSVSPQAITPRSFKENDFH